LFHQTFHLQRETTQRHAASGDSKLLELRGFAAGAARREHLAKVVRSSPTGSEITQDPQLTVPGRCVPLRGFALEVEGLVEVFAPARSRAWLPNDELPGAQADADSRGSPRDGAEVAESSSVCVWRTSCAKA
jgi:hypothetical protein